MHSWHDLYTLHTVSFHFLRRFLFILESWLSLQRPLTYAVCMAGWHLTHKLNWGDGWIRGCGTSAPTQLIIITFYCCWANLSTTLQFTLVLLINKAPIVQLNLCDLMQLLSRPTDVFCPSTWVFFSLFPRDSTCGHNQQLREKKLSKHAASFSFF